MKLLLNCNDVLATWCHLWIFSAVIFNAGFLSTGVYVVGSAPCFPLLSLIVTPMPPDLCQPDGQHMRLVDVDFVVDITKVIAKKTTVFVETG